MKMNYILKGFLALSISAIIIILITNFFYVSNIDMSNDIARIKYLYTSDMLSNFAIIKLFSKSDFVLKTIYILQFMVLTLQIGLLIYNVKKSFFQKTTDFTITATLSLGTIGTMYSIAKAISIPSGEIYNISDIIKTNFLDALYTTIFGLSIAVIIVGINIFYKKAY